MREMKILSLLCLTLLVFPNVSLATPVPDTGFTNCVDEDDIIPCPQPGEPFYGQDAQYSTNPQSYTKLDASGNPLPDDAPWPWSMVKDNVTGLIWEVKTDKDDIPNYANPHDADNEYTWYDSNPATNGGNPGFPGDGTDTEDFIAALNETNFGGYSDWRLPTVKELSFIKNMDNYSTHIDTTYFPNTVAAYYQTSTSYLSLVWIVLFQSGEVWDLVKSSYSPYHARAVRGDAQTSNNIIDNGDGTLTDTGTGLMWQQSYAGNPTWEGALYYCENLTLAGYNDWRLPNINELQSFVVYTYSTSVISQSLIGGEECYYWSSTPRSVNEAWTFFCAYYGDIAYGSIVYAPMGLFMVTYVRAVRGGQCGSFGDTDGDVVCDDGDSNGIPGDNPCINGEKLNCDDNCPSDANSLQEDSSPPQGNGIGDACDCEGDFDCDGDCDGTDASTFKMDFGRSAFENPCEGIDPCNGDFDCDNDCDGTDAARFKLDFGRSSFNNPCPACTVGGWCNY
jgi:hypothetical protein